MNPLDYDAIMKDFTIVEELTGEEDTQAYHVYQAYLNVSRPLYVALKEIDGKRAEIYGKLCGKWHPNLAAVFEVQKLEHAKEGEPQYLCVTEFVYGQSLAELVSTNGPLPVETALEYTKQIAEGIAFMHKQGLVHKDIKPDNVMITKDRASGRTMVKIIDLGISENYREDRIYATEIGGTIGYRAPEVNDYVATPQSDIFSLGCVLNFMLCGMEPSVRKYRGQIGVERIIAKAANLEASQRYSSIESMMRAVSHENRDKLWDKMPVLRSIPGYRSHTGYKMIGASVYYGYLLYYLLFQLYTGNCAGAVIGACFYCLIPWLIICDSADILYRINHHRPISSNTKWWIGLLVVVSCLLIPYLLGFGFPIIDLSRMGGGMNG